MTCTLHSLTAALLATLLCGCGGIRLSHRAVDLSVGANDEVVLVDGFHLLNPLLPEDPDLAPTVIFVDLASERVEHDLQEVEEGDALQHAVHSPNRERLALVTKTGRVHLLDTHRNVLQRLAVAENALETTQVDRGLISIRRRIKVADAAWIPGQDALVLSYEAHPTCSGEHDPACGPRVGRLGLSGQAVVELRQEAPEDAKLPDGPSGAGPLACTPDGSLLLAMGDDAQLRAWTLEPFAPAWTLDCSDWGMPTLHPLTIAVSPDGASVVVGGDTHLACYDVTTQAALWRQEIGTQCRALDFARGGTQLVALVEQLDGTRMRGELRFLDPATGELRESHDLAGDPTALGVTPTGDQVVVGHAYEVEAFAVPEVR